MILVIGNIASTRAWPQRHPDRLRAGRLIALERADQIEMRIVRINRSANPLCQCCNHQVRQADIVSLGGEFASKGRGVAPVLPVRFQIVSQPQPGRSDFDPAPRPK